MEPIEHDCWPLSDKNDSNRFVPNPSRRQPTWPWSSRSFGQSRSSTTRPPRVAPNPSSGNAVPRKRSHTSSQKSSNRHSVSDNSSRDASPPTNFTALREKLNSGQVTTTFSSLFSGDSFHIGHPWDLDAFNQETISNHEASADKRFATNDEATIEDLVPVLWRAPRQLSTKRAS